MNKAPIWIGAFAALLPMSLISSLLTFVVVIAAPTCPADAAGGVADPNNVPSGAVGSMGWHGVQLQNAAYIINAGYNLGLSLRDQTIGVMTAMGESSLIVLDHGDGAGPDSRGLFQQRASGWGSYECRMNPTCSSQSFFRALMKIPNRTSMTPTAVAHAVQINADPNHYTKFWSDAQQVVAALVGGGSAADTLSDGSNPDASASSECTALAAGDMSSTIAFALSLVGKYKYSWGGGGINGPSYGIGDGADIYGFDCSGFVEYVVYKTRHIDVGGWTGAQVDYFKSKGLLRRTNSAAALLPGDLVFFSRSGTEGGVYHVALVTKQGWIVEAPGRGRDIQHNPISERMPYDIWAYARLGVASTT